MRVERVAQCLPPIKSPLAKIADGIYDSAVSVVRRFLPSAKLANDAFERQTSGISCQFPLQSEPFSKKQISTFFSFPYTFFSKQNLDALSPQNYENFLKYSVGDEVVDAFSEKGFSLSVWQQKISQFAQRKKSPSAKLPDAKEIEKIEHIGKIAGLFEDTSEISSYGEIILKSLRRLFSDKRMKVIGIGQSPASVIEYLSLKGIDTAMCPISDLSQAECQVKKLAGSRRAEKYFQYLKNFGLNVDAIDTGKTHVFVDFEVSGNSVKNFKTLISKRLPKKTDTMFVGLQSLRESVQKEIPLEQQEAASKFEGMSLWTCALKSLYSPIFRLPVEELENVAIIHKKSCPNNKNVAFNKLTVLLYEKLYGKSKIN